jgi:hypothetical protein
MKIENLAHSPDRIWDDKQQKMAMEFRRRIESAFDDMPNAAGFYFSHAAAVLRQYADELE